MATVQESPAIVNPDHYSIPAEVRCKNHGLVKPEPQGKRTKDGHARMGVYCPKCLNTGKSGYIKWVPKKAEFYTDKEKAFALKYFPGQQSHKGLEIPTPRFTKTEFEHQCLACSNQKAKWATLGWSKAGEPIRAIICSGCKGKLTDWYEKKRAERGSR